MARADIVGRFRVSADAPADKVDLIHVAVDLLARHFGVDWLAKTFPATRFSTSEVPSILSYHRALKTTDTIGNGARLRTKLLEDGLDPHSKSFAEAEVARRLLSLGATVEYEPSGVGPKVPDFRATWSVGDDVYVEVSRLELASQDKIQR